MQAEDEFGRLEVYIDFGDKEYQKQCIYTYTTDGQTFISDSAEDDAWFKALLYKYESGIITSEEMEAEYGVLSQRYIKDYVSYIIPGLQEEKGANDPLVAESTPPATRATSTVMGYLYWEAENNNGGLNNVFLKYTKVELYRKIGVVGVLIGTTYTDANGIYSFTFNNDNYEVFLRVYPASTTFQVASFSTYVPLTFSNYYYIDSPAAQTANSATTVIMYSVAYNGNSNTTKAHSVSQSIVVAQRFALEMGMNSNVHINVIFPSPFPTSLCTGNSGVLTAIWITGNDWKKWDVPSHEYGHFVEHKMGIYGTNVFWELIVGGIVGGFAKSSHDSGKDLLYEKASYGKAFAMQLAYSESWATALSQIAQEKYKSEYYSVAGAGDRQDGGLPDFSTFLCDTNSGEGQEHAVISFLWDLYSMLGYQGFWTATTQSGTYTLTDLVAKLEAQYPSYRNQIGQSLSKHQIAPKNLVVSYTSGLSYPLSLSWTMGGSTNNPNNRFRVCFYDLSGNFKYETTELIASPAGSGSTYMCILSQSDLNTALSKFPAGTTAIKIAIKGYLSTSPQSGPFITAYSTTINL